MAEGEDRAEKLAGALHEDWRRRVQPLVAHHADAAVANGRDIAPYGIFERPAWVGFAPSGGPGEDNYVRSRRGHLLVGHFLARRDNRLAPGDLDEFSDPGRGTDARIGPGFAIDARPNAAAGSGGRVVLRARGDLRQVALHLADHAGRRRGASGDAAEQMDV